MSENRRNRRYSRSKVIIAKREDRNQPKANGDLPVQPKILLKAKEKENTTTGGNSSTSTSTSTSQAQTNVTESTTQSSPNILPRDTPATISTSNETSIDEPVPVMTRPVTLISGSTLQLNSSASKVLIKTNTDFIVVGVIGRQGVGKSTIMSLLAEERIDFDIYQTLIKGQEGIFPIKIKSSKSSAWPRTESVQMYITQDRLILLDSPPVLCNPYKKDATTSEIDDLQSIIVFLKVCHLIIVVQDGTIDMNLMRLLQFAELTKPNADNKSLVSDYFPSVLFVNNKAKRKDFLPAEKLKMDKILTHFFKDSQLKVRFGQTDKQKRSKPSENEVERKINYFVFPEMNDQALMTPFHPSLELLATDLRNRIYSTPRHHIYNATIEFNEGLWFDLATNASAHRNQFFLTSYEETRRNHTYSGNNTDGAHIGNRDILD